jgi:chaperonin GroES
MTPTQDFVVVQRIKPKLTTLYTVTEVDDGKPREGIVLAVGPGRYRETGDTRIQDVPLAVGATVWYHPSAGTLISWPGVLADEEVRIMPSRDVLLVQS